MKINEPRRWENETKKESTSRLSRFFISFPVVFRSFVFIFLSRGRSAARNVTIEPEETRLYAVAVDSLKYFVARHKKSTTVYDRKENHEVIVARAATYAIRSCRQSGVHCLPESPVGSRSSTLFARTACLLVRPPSPYRTTLRRSMYDNGARFTSFFSSSAIIIS